MHNYIYQISEKRPQKGEWVTSEYLWKYPDFLSVADSVDDVLERAHVIGRFGSWLAQNHLGTMSGDCFILAPEAAERYFAGRFAAFQQAMSALQALNENQFLHEHCLIQNLINDLGRIFTDKLNAYVLLDDIEEAVPMDEFMRSAKAGIPYYIGGVLDYHF